MMTLSNAPQVTRWLLAGGLVLLLVAVSLGSFVAGRGFRSDDAATVQPTAASGDEQQDNGNAGSDETVYYCSMHPQITSTDPDEPCPICGMDLIPKPTDGDDGDTDLPVLRLSERSARLLEIRTMPAERRAAETEVRFVGKLDYDERRLRDVVARSQSYVERLDANYLWTAVREGEPLAAFYSPQVTAAARELLLVQQSHAARRNPNGLEAGKARLERLGVSADQVDAILETGEIPRMYEVRSPIDGVVAELNVREGEWLGEGGRLLRVADLSTLWLQLEAFESDLQWLRVGQTASFTVQSYPGEVFEGEVTFVNPSIDPGRRTTRVRVEVPNPDGLLKPGMFARGTVRAEVTGQSQGVRRVADDAAAEPPLMIPASAPLITGRRAVVYVRQPNTDRPTFEGRQIVLGPRVGDHYVVREGLEEGEQVVSRGAFKIDSELQIRGRPSMMARAELFGEEPEAEPRIPADHPAHAVDPADVPDAFAHLVAEAFDRYLELTAALADDDFDAARQAVVDYHDHLLAMDAGSLDPTTRDAWQAVDVELHNALHAMAGGEELEAIREHLEPLSDYTALAVTAFARGHVEAMYRVHCPMAFDNEGADWLQADEQVANPYFGAVMLQCGVVQDDLLGKPADDPAEPADPANAHDPAAADDYPLDVCLVSGQPLDSMGGPVSYMHQGREIRFCCAACEPQFEADPDRFLPKFEQASPEPTHNH